MNTAKIYDGPSMLDNDARIVVLVSGLRNPSRNTKTADLLQVWILLYDVAPHVAQQTGQDDAVCGDCPLRPYLSDARPDHLPLPCYVTTMHGPRAVWSAARDLPVTDPALVRGMVTRLQTVTDGHWRCGTPRTTRKRLPAPDVGVRLGSYGDPAAVPPHILPALLG